MAAKQIGTLTFDIMRGRPVGPVQLTETRERNGCDGAEIRKLGKRERDVRIRTTKTALDEAAATLLVTSYEDEIGELLDIIDAGNNTHSDCLIRDVRTRVAGVINPTSDATHTRQVRAVWTVRELST